jgi:cation transport ATPase
LEELENVEFEEEEKEDDEDEGSQEDYEEMQAKEKLKSSDMFAKSMMGRKKKEQRPTVRSPKTTKAHKKNSSSPHKSKKTSIWQVTVLTVVMALGAGLGAVPFFFVKTLSSSWRGIATAIACGVMFAASFDLVHEGQPQGGTLVILGLVLGTVFIRITQHYLDGIEDVKVRIHIVVCLDGKK